MYTCKKSRHWTGHPREAGVRVYKQHVGEEVGETKEAGLPLPVPLYNSAFAYE